MYTVYIQYIIYSLIIRCTLLFGTMNSVHCTVYTIPCTLYSVQGIVYTVQCTEFIVPNSNVHRIIKLYIMYCIYTVYIVHCTVYNVHLLYTLLFFPIMDSLKYIMDSLLILLTNVFIITMAFYFTSQWIHLNYPFVLIGIVAVL